MNKKNIEKEKKEDIKKNELEEFNNKRKLQNKVLKKIVDNLNKTKE